MADSTIFFSPTKLLRDITCTKWSALKFGMHPNVIWNICYVMHIHRIWFRKSLYVYMYDVVYFRRKLMLWKFLELMWDKCQLYPLTIQRITTTKLVLIVAVDGRAYKQVVCVWGGGQEGRVSSKWYASFPLLFWGRYWWAVKYPCSLHFHSGYYFVQVKVCLPESV